MFMFSYFQFDHEIPYFLIKQRIFDSYKQSWYASMNNSNRLEMYSRYKHEFLRKLFRLHRK